MRRVHLLESCVDTAETFVQQTRVTKYASAGIAQLLYMIKAVKSMRSRVEQPP